MEDDTDVRKLVELIFSKQFENIEEMKTSDLSIPACLLTKHFLPRLHGVIYMKESFFHAIWEKYLEFVSRIIFSSHRMYIRCVIWSCLNESKNHENVFEIFISVCTLLKFFNERILTSTGTKFHDLNTDIFMVVYDSVMKADFCEKGGFQQFVEYIHGHGYYKMQRNERVSSDPDVELSSIQVDKEFESHLAVRTADVIREMQETSGSLIPKVFSLTSVELPTLSNNPVLRQRLKESWSEERLKKSREIIKKAAGAFARVDTTSRESSSSNSDSETDDPLNQDNLTSGSVDSGLTSQGCSSSNSASKTDQTISTAHFRLGRMIPLVLEHYYSRFSRPANPDSHVEKKGDGTM